MDQFLKLAPFLAVPIALASFLFSFAKATPEETAKVKSWAPNVCMALICVGGLGWYGLQCEDFTSSAEPITRKAIFEFAMNLVNLGLAGTSLLLMLASGLKRSKAAKRRKKEIDLHAKLLHSVFEKANRYTDSKIQGALDPQNDLSET